MGQAGRDDAPDAHIDVNRSRGMAVAATAIAAVLIGVVAAYTYAWSTSPLVYGNAAALNTGEMTTDPDPGVGQAFQFRFVDGGRIAWGIDVRNNLLIPVTIRGLNPDVAGFNSLTTDRQLNLSRSDAIGVSPDELRPFEAVELAPNQHVFVAVTEVFTDCRTARALRGRHRHGARDAPTRRGGPRRGASQRGRAPLQPHVPGADRDGLLTRHDESPRRRRPDPTLRNSRCHARGRQTPVSCTARGRPC